MRIMRLMIATECALDLHGPLDWTMAFLDGSFVPAKNGGETARLTRTGKGNQKHHEDADHRRQRQRSAVRGSLDSATRQAVRLADHTLDTVCGGHQAGSH